MKRILTLLAALGLFTSVCAHAADPVTDAITQAYGPYRAALFRTNSKAQAESEQAIAQTQQAWKSIMDRFAGKPPIPYDSDSAFGATLNEVAKVYEQAATEIRDRKLPQAHETLEKARDLIAELRRRNGTIVFSDHMNAYHAEMEHLLEQGPALTTAPQGVLTLMERVGVLGYLAARLRSQAPKTLMNDAEFGTALQALEASVAALRQAVIGQDATVVRDALGKLKTPYSRMFLKFG